MDSTRNISDDLRTAGVPESWKLYSTNNDDSFFDCVSEAVKNIRLKAKCNAQILREFCKYTARLLLKEQKQLLESILKKRDKFSSIRDYIRNIDICPKEATEIGLEPIYGLPDVEGYLICKKFNIQLHVLISNEDESEYTHRIFSIDGKNDKVSYTEQFCIHIVQRNSKFEALLRYNEKTEPIEKISDELVATGVPEHWKLYSTTSEDSFFDCMSEALKNIRPKSKFDSDTLRADCKNMAKKMLKEQKQDLIDILKKRHNFSNIGNYIRNIDICPKDVTDMEIEELIYGVPEIEGYLICQKLNIQLHVLTPNEEESKYSHMKIIEDGKSSISYTDTNYVHIVQRNFGQFDAILRTDFTSTSKNRKQPNGKRPGTINLGHEFEQGISTLLAIRCAFHKEIRDFTIETNVDGYDALDDVVLKLYLQNNEEHIFLFQLKYKNDTISYKSAFEREDGIFFLEKYEKSYRNLPIKHKKNIHLVFFTNTNFKEKSVNELDIYNEHFIKSIVSTSEKGKLFRVRNCNNDDFLSKLLVATEQTKAEQIARALNDTIKKELNLIDYGFGQTSVKEILEHFKIWNRSSTPIKRTTVRSLLFETILTPLLYEYIPITKQSQCFDIVINTFNHFNSAFISEDSAKLLQDSVFTYVEQCFKLIDFKMDSWTMDLCQKNINIIFETKMNDLTLYRTHFIERKKVNGTITKRDVYLIMCRLRKIPMVLNYNEQNKKIIDVVLTILQDIFLERSIVLVKSNKTIKNIPLEHSFHNLFHLRKLNNKLFKNNIKQIKSSLFSNQRFEHLINSNNQIDIMKTIHPDAYLQQTCQNLIIHQDIEELKYYVERSLKVPVLKHSVLHEFTEQFYVINSGKKFIPKYKGSNVVFSKIDINEIIKEIMEMNNLNKPVHILKATKEYLQWVYTKGSVEKLKKYLCFNIIKEENISDLLEENQIQVICSNAGMGKTTLLQKYQVHNKANSCPILINLNKHAKILQSISNFDESKNVKIIFKILNWPANDSTFEYRKEVFKLLLNSGNITWLVDGFDEVDGNQLRPFLTFIKNTKCKILISTRSSKQSEIENMFSILCLDLMPFSRQDQTQFLKRYLNSTLSENEIEKKLDSLKNLNENLVGIPLQTKLCTDMFSQKENLERTEFSLVYLFDHFLNRNFEKIKDKSYEMNLSKLSLCLFFDQNVLNTVTLDAEEIQIIVNDFKENMKKDFIVSGFNDDDDPIFTHRTYAEFLCAKWLAKKLRIAGSKEVYIKLFEKLFCNELSQVRLFFDQIVAEDLPLHSAVLNSDIDKIKQILQENVKMLHEKDEFGRTALHLAASYGNRIIFHTKNDIDGIKSGGEYSTIEEIKGNYKIKLPPYRNTLLVVKHEIIELLLEKGSQNTKDNLLNLDSIGYSLKSCSLENANLLCRKLNDQLGEIDLILNKDNIPLVLYCAIVYTFNNLFKYFVRKNNCEIAKKKYNGRNLLFLAIESSNSTILKTLYEIGVDVEDNVDGKLIWTYALDTHQSDSHNILMDIYHDYQMKKIDNLIKFNNGGQNFAFQDKDYENLLRSAAGSGNLKVLNWLLERETDLKKIDLNNIQLLHCASGTDNVSVSERVLQLGIEIDCTDFEGKTSLHIAAINGHTHVLNFLIEKGADCNKLGNNKQNLLHFACKSDNVSVVNRILGLNFKIDCTDNQGSTPLHIAAANGNLNVLNLLLENDADYNKSDHNRNQLLHYACHSNNVSLVNRIIKLGFEVNCVEKQGLTPLHIAAASGNLNVLNLLLENGADYNKSDHNKKQLLHYACQSSNVSLVNRVMELGFSINCIESQGLTPLHIAAASGNLNVLKLLLENGADYDKSDHNRKQLLHYACLSSNVSLVNRVLELGFEVNCVDNQDSTPLHIAALKGNLNVFNLLIEKGADYKKLGYNRRCLFHYAAESNNILILEKVLSLEIDINTADKSNQTPFTLAQRSGKLKSAKWIKFMGGR